MLTIADILAPDHEPAIYVNDLNDDLPTVEELAEAMRFLNSPRHCPAAAWEGAVRLRGEA